MQDTYIVIPCYNEVQRLNHEAFWSYYEQLPQCHFVFVDDGSTDGTKEIFVESAFAKANIHTFTLPENRGKAEAVRAGALFALEKGAAYIAYFDADFAAPLTEVKLLWEAMQEDPQRSIILGSRLYRAGAKIERRAKRHYTGRIFATIIGLFILKTPVFDTQCGAKLMTAACASQVFEQPFVSRWLFDVEILVRLEKQLSPAEMRKQVYEQPLKNWAEKKHSKINMVDLLRLPSELIVIFSGLNSNRKLCFSTCSFLKFSTFKTQE